MACAGACDCGMDLISLIQLDSRFSLAAVYYDDDDDDDYYYYKQPS